MKSMSLVFDADVQPEDLEALQSVRGCLGVSSYRNTVNLYFRQLDTGLLASVAAIVRRRMGATVAPLAFAADDDFSGVYASLQVEAAA